MTESQETPSLDGVNGEDDAAEGERPMPVSQPVFVRALRWSILSTVILILAFAGIGYLVSGERGLIGGIIGATAAGIFLGMTIGSIAFANRYVESDLYLPLFFGIVVGSWILKFIIFIIAALLLKDQPWLDPTILFIAVICSVILSLVIDALVVMKSRIPIISNPR